MFVLSAALDQAGGDYRTALAAYNCGWESLEEDRCIDGGGWDYADKVMTFWLPIVEESR